MPRIYQFVLCFVNIILLLARYRTTKFMGNSRESRMVAPTDEILNFHFSSASVFDGSENGLYFRNIYIPEEVVTLILSHVNAKHLLNLSLVCKNWCRIIKSYSLWSIVYKRHYGKQPKRLPWYVFYCLFATKYLDNNLLVNGNGELQLKHWLVVNNGGDGWRIEDEPYGANPLPENVPEFNGKKSCFATSFQECTKTQTVHLTKNRLLLYIVNKYRPSIYLSEWVAGRFDCGCVYRLRCSLHNREEIEHESVASHRVEQWAGSVWSKVELLVDVYKGIIEVIDFEHSGCDTQFWKGYYGSKMAGGVLKIQFDSINPLEEEQ